MKIERVLVGILLAVVLFLVFRFDKANSSCSYAGSPFARVSLKPHTSPPSHNLKISTDAVKQELIDQSLSSGQLIALILQHEMDFKLRAHIFALQTALNLERQPTQPTLPQPPSLPLISLSSESSNHWPSCSSCCPPQTPPSSFLSCPTCPPPPPPTSPPPTCPSCSCPSPSPCPPTTPTTPSTSTPPQQQEPVSESHEYWQRRWGQNNRSVQCIRHADGSEACLYEEVCDDGKTLFLKDSFGDLATTHKPVKEPIDYRFHEIQADKFKAVQDIGIPFHYESDIEVVPASEWDKVLAVPNTTHVRFGYLSVLETPVPRGGNNLWHFSQSVSMILDPQFHNETGMYPPMDAIVVRALGDLSKWTNGMMQLLVPANTSNLIVMQPGARICIQTAVVLGYRRGIFLGNTDATMFRERSYQRLGLSVHPTQRETLTFPLRVKFFNRGNSRHMESPTNAEFREALMANGGPDKYDFEIVEDMSALSFAQQVSVWASADLIMMPHGAGLTNMIFARNHVPVIEIFPRHFVPEMYRSVASGTGHPYFCVMSERIDPKVFKVPINEINCEYLHGIDLMNQGECHQEFKNSMLRLNVTKLLVTIEMALETLPLKSFPPTRRFYDPIRPANDPLGKPGNPNPTEA